MTSVPSPYGLHRSILPAGAFPQLAWKLDAGMGLQDNEIEIAVERLHLDASSLRQLKEEHGADPLRIRDAIRGIVAERGKMHNPKTNSGGILTGLVKSVGEKIQSGPKTGVRIASLVSLSLTPLRLSAVRCVDIDTAEVEVDGTAYLFQTGAWAYLPSDLPESVSLAAFDIAGAPARVRMRCKPRDRVVIFGAGRSGVMSAAAAAECAADSITLIDIDPARLKLCADLGIPRLTVLHADARDAQSIAARLPNVADLTVSCVDVEGIEPACLVATKTDGHVLFFSMVTNFARAALSAEGMGSTATLEIGNGLAAGHADYALHILRTFPAVRALFATV